VFDVLRILDESLWSVFEDCCLIAEASSHNYISVINNNLVTHPSCGIC